MSMKSTVKGLLIKRTQRGYKKLLQKKKVSYEDWLSRFESEQEEQEAQKEGITCEYVVFRAGEGVFLSGFGEQIRRYVSLHPEVQVLYMDEDVKEGGHEKGRSLPWFKPDWSPDLFDSFFYFGSVVVIRRELVYHRMRGRALDESVNKEANEMQFQNFTRKEQDDCQGMECYAVTDFAAYEMWIHRLVELAGGYARGSLVVGHIAKPLFTAVSPESRQKFLVSSAFLKEKRKVELRQFRKEGQPGKISEGKKEETAVSVVILSKDHPKLLESCLKGCRIGAKRKGMNSLSYEVILVDNGSSDHNRRQVEALVQKERASGGRITYQYHPMPFHFSAMCHLGAMQASGRLLLFLNDDVELCREGCMEEMAALADRPWTGAVGMKLYYPQSNRIQHRGITNLPMGPVHKLQFLEDERYYYYGANRGRHNVLAVTAACLMVAREKYVEAGGFAEALPVAFNDVDLCFRLYELGYANVCLNDMFAYHHESLSRGNDETPEKLKRLIGERDKLYERHPKLEGVDPYYSIHLNREGLDVMIRPAYMTAGNAVQMVKGRPEVFLTKDYRQDACLMVRVEDCRQNRIVGYGVVLGDDNACYEKILLLERIEADAAEPQVYGIKTAGQYRPDLEENMPDQSNVGLSGFMVDVGRNLLSKGRYRVGMGARNRITGLKILNWSNRELVICQ